MKRHIFIAVLFLMLPVVINAQDIKSNLEKHVYTLANDSLYGRAAGSAQALVAAEYIIGQFKEIGVEPYKENKYMQRFMNSNHSHTEFNNIIGIIPGSAPELKNEYIVVGAHYDHLGYKIVKGDTVVYNGADDNASGVAVLIEMARMLKASQGELGRSIILIAFDAEEIGLVGSKCFANNPIVPIESIKLMISADMVGWYKASGKLKYNGTGTIKKGASIVKSPSLVPEGLNVVTRRFEKGVFTATDTQPFAKKGIPTLFTTTGIKSPYHKPGDDADLIDYDGMVLVTQHLNNVVKNISADKNYRASGKLALQHRSKPPKFNAGIRFNIGTNHYYYTAGAVNGKNGGAYSIGLWGDYNMLNMLAIRPEVLYERLGAEHPDGKIWTDNVTTPLSLVLKTYWQQAFGFEVSLGGYYSYRFSGKQDGESMNFRNDYYRNEGGITFGLGLRFNKFILGYTNRTALSNLNRNKNADGANIRNRANYFTLSYIF